MSLQIDLSPTGLQGDSGLAAAPLAPGALLVSDSNLGQILSPMKQMTVLYLSTIFNLDYSNLRKKDQVCTTSNSVYILGGFDTQ